MTYPTASLTADLCIFRVYTDKETHLPIKAELLLIERGGEPYKGHLALPGGFVNAANVSLDAVDRMRRATGSNIDAGETFLEAAIRELREETGLDAQKDVIVLDAVGVYDAPGRDPRGRVISQAFSALVLAEETGHVAAGDDAAAVRWVDITEIDTVDLAFDHNVIVADAIRKSGLVSPASL